MMIRTSIAAAVLAASSVPAIAAPMSVEEAFNLFNGISEGDFNSSQEVEGRLYVGGDLTGSTIQIGFKDVTPSSYASGIVKGNTTIGTINMQNGSDLTVGGNVASNVNMNGAGAPATANGNQTARIGGTQTSGTFNIGTKLENQATLDPNFASRFPEIDFASFVNESQYLSSLTGTSLSFPDQNNKQILGSATATPLTVYTVDISDLNGGTWTIDSKLSDTVLINVTGTSGTFGGNVNGAQTNPSAGHIVWNFYEATSVNVNTAILGSVLAPLATLSGFSGSTEGSVIAKAINLTNGELHSRPFEGSLPSASPVPLPAGLPLLGGALAGVGLLRRAAKGRRTNA